MSPDQTNAQPRLEFSLLVQSWFEENVTPEILRARKTNDWSRLTQGAWCDNKDQRDIVLSVIEKVAHWYPFLKLYTDVSDSEEQLIRDSAKSSLTSIPGLESLALPAVPLHTTNYSQPAHKIPLRSLAQHIEQLRVGQQNLPYEQEEVADPLTSTDGEEIAQKQLYLISDELVVSPDDNGQVPELITGETAYNHVAHERANLSHKSLERKFAILVDQLGFDPFFNQNIDMYFRTPEMSVIAEMKSCTRDNYRAQVMKGFSQLKLYRRQYASIFTGPVILALVLEAAPPQEHEWMMQQWLELDGIVPLWVQEDNSFATSVSSVPPLIEDLIKLSRLRSE